MQRITPFLWFDQCAEEAVHFYTSIFKNSRVREVSRYGDAGPGPRGSVMVIRFELDGEQFMALNGGPAFSFTEAVSLVVNCKDQREVDHYWEALSAGGRTIQCGWLKDKFGLSWQVVPTVLGKLMQDKDEQKRDRVMKAMMGMVKLDVDGLERAAA